MNPPLSIITINYFEEIELERCFASLRKFEPRLQFELVVVDNGSTGDKLKAALSQIEQSVDLKLIHNPENVGFTRACNQGVAMSRGEYVLLLNPDILFVEDSISRMINFLNHHPHVGAVGCKQVLPSGRHYVGDAGYYPSLLKAISHSFFLSRFFPRFFEGIYLVHGTEVKEPDKVDWVSGGCLLFRRVVLKQAGMFDESFFIYSVDVEWCKRIKQSGWQVSYLSSTHVVHRRQHHQSGGRRSVMGLESQRILFRRHHGRISTLLFEIVILSGWGLRSIAYLFLHFITKNPDCKQQAREFLYSILTYLRQII